LSLNEIVVGEICLTSAAEGRVERGELAVDTHHDVVARTTGGLRIRAERQAQSRSPGNTGASGQKMAS
jgi:hypothetical protein